MISSNRITDKCEFLPTKKMKKCHWIKPRKLTFIRLPSPIHKTRILSPLFKAIFRFRNRRATPICVRHCPFYILHPIPFEQIAPLFFCKKNRAISQFKNVTWESTKMEKWVMGIGVWLLPFGGLAMGSWTTDWRPRSFGRRTRNGFGGEREEKEKKKKETMAVIPKKDHNRGVNQPHFSLCERRLWWDFSPKWELENFMAWRKKEREREIVFLRRICFGILRNSINFSFDVEITPK